MYFFPPALPTVAFPIPGHGRPCITEQKGVGKAGAEPTGHKAQQMLTLDCPGPDFPLHLSVYSWPERSEKRKMVIWG